MPIAKTFIFFIDNEEEHVKHSKSDNTEIVINDEANEILKQLFDSLKNRYQINLDPITCSKLVFDYVHILY